MKMWLRKLKRRKLKQKDGKSEVDSLEREDLLKTFGKQVSENGCKEKKS